MRTVTDAEDDLQLFWQAFPAEGGAARTTYMFSYADCAKQRPSLQVPHASCQYASMRPSVRSSKGSLRQARWVLRSPLLLARVLRALTEVML